MSMRLVRRLAWTAIILFTATLIFAFNHGSILAWLAANRGPLLDGLLWTPFWTIAFLLSVMGLICYVYIIDSDDTPLETGLHALGIMLCIAWWTAAVILTPRQSAGTNMCAILFGLAACALIAWRMDRRQETGRETFPKLRDQIADYALTHIASETYRNNHQRPAGPPTRDAAREGKDNG